MERNRRAIRRPLAWVIGAMVLILGIVLVPVIVADAKARSRWELAVSAIWPQLEEFFFWPTPPGKRGDGEPRAILMPTEERRFLVMGVRREIGWEVQPYSLDGPGTIWLFLQQERRFLASSIHARLELRGCQVPKEWVDLVRSTVEDAGVPLVVEQ